MYYNDMNLNVEIKYTFKHAYHFVNFKQNVCIKK